MKRELYIQIKDYLHEVIRGTEFEGHVMTVGGCVRDELMGLEIKDIDMCVSLPDGGICKSHDMEIVDTELSDYMFDLQKYYESLLPHHIDTKPKTDISAMSNFLMEIVLQK